MNVTNLPYNDLLSYPLRLLLDDTAIVWGYRALANALFVTYGFLSKICLRLILTMKSAGIPEFGPFPTRLYFLGGTMRLRLVPRCRLINFIVAILANTPPEIRFRMK